jgi:hypothetical protein
MGNLHQVVINNVSQMVCRETIRLHQDKVFLRILLLEPPVNGIMELRPTKLVALEANHMRLSSFGPAIRLVGVYGAACPWVNSRLARLVEFTLLGFKLFGSTEATVGMVMVQEGLDVFMIDGQSLRLQLGQIEEITGVSL